MLIVRIFCYFKNYILDKKGLALFLLCNIFDIISTVYLHTYINFKF